MPFRREGKVIYRLLQIKTGGKNIPAGLYFIEYRDSKGIYSAGSIVALLRWRSPQLAQSSRRFAGAPSARFASFLRFASSATGGAQLRNPFRQSPLSSHRPSLR
jgi:hypothetical protein